MQTALAGLCLHIRIHVLKTEVARACGWLSQQILADPKFVKLQFIGQQDMRMGANAHFPCCDALGNLTLM